MCPTHILIPRSFHCIQAHLWAWGRGDVSTPTFGSHLNSISIGGRGADYSHSILVFWKPQARLVYISSGVKIDLLIHFLNSMSTKWSINDRNIQKRVAIKKINKKNPSWMDHMVKTKLIQTPKCPKLLPLMSNDFVST